MEFKTKHTVVIIIVMYIQELHLYAAINVMEQLEPPLQKDNPNPNLSLWLNRIRLCRNAIKSIITLRSKSKLVDKARYVTLKTTMQ